MKATDVIERLRVRFAPPRHALFVRERLGDSESAPRCEMGKTLAEGLGMLGKEGA